MEFGFMTVGEVAKNIPGSKAVDISQLLHKNGIEHIKLCPIICGRRLVPFELVDEIRDALATAGKLALPDVPPQARESLQRVDSVLAAVTA